MRIDPEIKPCMDPRGKEVSKERSPKRVDEQRDEVDTRIKDPGVAKERMRAVISQISIQPSLAVMAHVNLDPNRASTLVGGL
jgi:hypothetical protein